ncbi:MAG: hypothetical protein GXO27_07280 [Chlorobi bacterium]|nr:hypothetical protein [Chlorobiota bacterium]
MKKLLWLGLFVWFLPALRAQESKVVPDETTPKLAMLRQKLLLNDKEFEAFAPAFKEFEKEKRKLLEKRKTLLKNLKAMQAYKLPDSEVDRLFRRLREIDRQLFELRNRHLDRIDRILPPRKKLAYWRHLQRHRFKPGKKAVYDMPHALPYRHPERQSTE